MEREKGSVSSMSCGHCGTVEPMVAMPDGGVAQAPCRKCYGSEKASAPEGVAIAPREKATEVAEDEA